METPHFDAPERTGRVSAGGVSLQGWALASVLAGLMLTLLLSALDQTIVGTAMPKIAEDLRGYDRYTWPATAYLLASTTMIPIVSKLSDLFGRKWFLMAGVVIFLVGSALSGASQSMNQLIAFRGLQGLGGGMLMSLVFTLIGDIFVPAERARWQGLFTGVFALASVLGPAVGGFITDNITWRWIFYVNLPIGIIALAALFFWLPSNISARSTTYTGWAAIRRIDFAGSLTAAAGTVCLLLGLTWGGDQTYAWGSLQVAGILVAAAVLFAAFVVAEFRALEPILPLDLFRNQIFAVGAILSLALGAALFAVAIYLPLFVQGVLGQSATNSGAVITPLTLTMAVGSAIIGIVISRVGRYQFSAIVGAVILTIGIYLLTRVTASTTLFEVTGDMIVVGLGMGMVQPVLTLAVQNAIPRNRLGVGTGAVTYLRSTGSTIGVAVLGAVEYSTFSDAIARRLPAAARPFVTNAQAAQLQQVLVSAPARQQVTDQTVHAAVTRAVAQATANVPPGPNHAQQVATITAQVTDQVTAQVTHLLGQVFEAARLSLATAIQHAFVVGLGVSLAIIVITLFLKDVPLTARGQTAPARQPAAGIPAAGDAAAIGEAEIAVR